MTPAVSQSGREFLKRLPAVQVSYDKKVHVRQPLDGSQSVKINSQQILKVQVYQWNGWRYRHMADIVQEIFFSNSYQK